jgi:thiaminase/transcriptional activator TenA
VSFTDSIAETADAVWTATVEHPMLRELGAGTLDEEPFRYWVRQDYYYLQEYARVFALGATKAPDIERMGRFATLLDGTLNSEMEFHRSYASAFGLTPAELEATKPSPTTRAYTDFLVRTAALGAFGDVVAALLPCMWGFNETAERLAARGRPDDDRYARWINMYTGEEFTELTGWCLDLMDEVAADATGSDRERYRELFLTSARYEYRFWDAAWRQERWEVGP